MTDKISIVVPVYNAECYLSQTIESLLNQTYKNRRWMFSVESW